MNIFKHLLDVVMQPFDIVVNRLFAVEQDEDPVAIQGVFHRNDLHAAEVVLVEVLADLVCQRLFLETQGLTGDQVLRRGRAFHGFKRAQVQVCCINPHLGDMRQLQAPAGAHHHRVAGFQIRVAGSIKIIMLPHLFKLNADHKALSHRLTLS